MKCASNGEEGIEIYKEFQPDIIFMDIEMPVMDGYKATEEIRDWERIIGLSPRAHYCPLRTCHQRHSRICTRSRLYQLYDKTNYQAAIS